ncbi:MAG: nuclear transport factor 2 family protein, partial [Cyanobacteriota bacterium]|nr:nuclear transport factor 2 family protein [Cyanobacteriota bacterium]
MRHPPLDAEQIRALFTKPYGTPGPTAAQWKAVYADDVHFTDPTQERQGIDAYIRAQEGLMQRCDDVFLETESVVVKGETAFVEWRMGLKIKGIEF